MKKSLNTKIVIRLFLFIKLLFTLPVFANTYDNTKSIDICNTAYCQPNISCKALNNNKEVIKEVSDNFFTNSFDQPGSASFSIDTTHLSKNKNKILDEDGNVTIVNTKSISFSINFDWTKETDSLRFSSANIHFYNEKPYFLYKELASEESISNSKPTPGKEFRILTKDDVVYMLDCKIISVNMFPDY